MKKTNTDSIRHALNEMRLAETRMNNTSVFSSRYDEEMAIWTRNGELIFEALPQLLDEFDELLRLRDKERSKRDERVLIDPYLQTK